jgi:hypothetical protein
MVSRDAVRPGPVRLEADLICRYTEGQIGGLKATARVRISL